LEKGNVVADFRRFIAGGAKGEGAGKFRHHLRPAFLAIFLFEDVLLSGRGIYSDGARLCEPQRSAVSFASESSVALEVSSLLRVIDPRSVGRRNF
jgi:hypothetical protein